MEPVKLTARQQRFIELYIKSGNATQAYIDARFSEKGANAGASRLLANVSIANAIKEGRAQLAESLGLDAYWVLKRLKEEVEADISDIHNDDGSLKPISEWPEAFRTGLVAGIEVYEEKNKEGKVTGYTKKIKLSDKMRRVEMVAQYLGMNKKQVELTGKNGEALQVESKVTVPTALIDALKNAL